MEYAANYNFSALFRFILCFEHWTKEQNPLWKKSNDW